MVWELMMAIVGLLQLIAIGFIIWHVFQFNRKWDLKFYRKSGQIFLIWGITIGLRLGTMLLVPETWKYAHFALIIVNFLYHIPIFFLLWLEFSTCYNYLSSIHLIYGLIFGSRLGILCIPSLTKMIEIGTSSVYYLIPRDVVPQILDILFYIPILDVLFRIWLKSREYYLGSTQKKSYRVFFVIFGLFCILSVLAIFTKDFWTFFLIEIGSLILYIGLAYFTKISPSFFILTKIRIKKLIIMHNSLTSLPLASLDFDQNSHANEIEILSIFQTLPVLLQHSKIYKLNPNSQFHLVQFGDLIIVLEMYQKFMGLLFLNKYHKIACESLHRIMIQFEQEWIQTLSTQHDSSQPLDPIQFLKIVQKADIELPIYKDE